MGLSEASILASAVDFFLNSAIFFERLALGFRRVADFWNF